MWAVLLVDEYIVHRYIYQTRFQVRKFQFDHNSGNGNWTLARRGFGLRGPVIGLWPAKSAVPLASVPCHSLVPGSNYGGRHTAHRINGQNQRGQKVPREIEDESGR